MKFDRRFFMIGATSLAAMPWVRRALIPPASAAASSLLFDGDMEIDAFESYETYGDSSNLRFRTSGNSPTISVDKARGGAKSARVYLNRKTSTTSYRTEAEATGTWSSLLFQKTYWIGFSIYVPSNWAVSNTWEVLFQLHHRPLDWSNTFNFSPILAIRCNPDSDQWRLVQGYVQTPDGAQQQSDLKTAFDGLYGQIARGKWTDWVLEYRPDWRSLSDGGVGVTRIWRDGARLVNYAGPNCVNNPSGPFIKFGCYKSAWKDREHGDPVVERLYYFDELRVSRPDQGSYELVAPGSATSAPPMPPAAIDVD